MAPETVQASEVEDEEAPTFEFVPVGGRAFVSHAGFIPRLVAYVLDLLLLAIPFVPWLRFGGGGAQRLLGLALPVLFRDPRVWWAWGLFALAAFVYFTALEAATGRTVGKRITGIRVTDLRLDEPSPGACLVRNAYRVLYHLPVAGAAVLALDGALVLLQGRRLGDLAGDTMVVKVPTEW